MEYGSKEKLKLAASLLREAAKVLVNCSSGDELNTEGVDMAVDAVQSALTTVKEVRVDEAYADLTK